MEYTIGTAVFNDWIIVREIGQGATGHVYEIKKNGCCEEIRSALKVIRIPKSPSDVKAVMSEGMTEADVTDYFKEFVDEILREIKIMVSLKEHPNIVTYEDHSVISHEDGIGWDILIKMELLTPLQDWQMDHPMNEKEIVQLGCEISSALSYAAEHKLIHRDVKPENIFVDSFGRFKLGDFGIARTIEKTTGGLSKKGTESYMAPEVYLGREYNEQVDIYSLGIVLYRFLNGNRLPFYPPEPEPIRYSDRENALKKRIQGDKLPDPLNGSYDLKKIVLKACEFYPQNRYIAMSELHNALQNVNNTSGTNSIDPFPQKKKKWTIVIAGVLVALSIGVILGGLGIKTMLAQKIEKNNKIQQTDETLSDDIVVETSENIGVVENNNIKNQKKNDSVEEAKENMEISNYDQALFYQQRNSLVNIQTGDSFLFGEYEQDNNPSNGKEQIEWEVLDKTDNKILVISKKALCCYPYLNEYENTTWADSEMRSWLNRSFYQDAFSSYHQEMILDTEVTADRNPEYSTDSGSDTNDKIYLLSIDEVKKYFNSQSSRMCQPTVYAKVQGSYLLDSNSWWWLRTPGKDGKHISLVYTDGEIVSEGFRTYVTDGTVRPVMWLDLSAVENVDVPAKLLENEKQNECKGIVAIDPSAIGVEDDEVFMEPVGPGAEPEETSYTTGGTGAVTGVREYNINLQIAKDLQEILLQKGYQVVMLRENNESKLMAMNRSLAAAEAGADILVVISCRKRQDIGENGAMAYVQRRSNPYVGYMYDECRDLAECILSEYCNTGIFSNKGIYETDSVRCINWSKIPVTNILLGCIKDASDEQKLANQNNWDLMAEGIADGIDKYFDKADLEDGNPIAGR